MKPIHNSWHFTSKFFSIPKWAASNSKSWISEKFCRSLWWRENFHRDELNSWRETAIEISRGGSKFSSLIAKSDFKMRLRFEICSVYCQINLFCSVLFRKFVLLYFEPKIILFLNTKSHWIHNIYTCHAINYLTKLHYCHSEIWVVFN